jgi:hypothetical protein
LQRMKKLYFLLLILVVTNSYSQTILIPYRSGKLWGLADTLGKIKVTPLYDTIQTATYFNQSQRYTEYAKGVFIIKKGNKYGLLKNTAVLMAPKYHRLLVDSLFIIEDRYNIKDPTIGGSHEVVYNMQAQVLIADSIMEIAAILNKSDHNLLYRVRGHKNNSGIFWYDPKQQKILQWVIKGVNTVFANEYVNNILHAAIYTTSASKPQNVDIVFNSTSNKYEYHDTPKLPNAGNQGSALYKGPSYHSTKNNFLLRNIVFQTSGNNILEIRKDRRYNERPETTDTIRFKLACDSVQVNKYIVSTSAEWHSTIPYDHQMLLDKIDTGFQYVNYITYQKNGKSGLIVENTVIPPLYKDILYIRAGNVTDKPFFMVSKVSETDGKVRWGVINSDNNTLLPCIYDQIVREGGGGFWMLKKDNLYGVADHQAKLVIPAIYEKVIPGAYFLSCDIFDKGKYGYISSLGISIKPTFPYKVNRPDTFSKYNVFELVDKNGKVLGYGDKKGFLYFNN